MFKNGHIFCKVPSIFYRAIKILHCQFMIGKLRKGKKVGVEVKVDNNVINIILLITESWILKIDIGKGELIVILQFIIWKEKEQNHLFLFLLFEFEVKGLKDFARPCLFSERISFFTSKAHDEMVLHHMIHGKALHVKF